MKNKKKNNVIRTTIIGVGVGVFAIIMGIVFSTSLRSPEYRAAYKMCKTTKDNSFVMSDLIGCRCFANCWEGLDKAGATKTYIDAYLTAEVCLARCIKA